MFINTTRQHITHMRRRDELAFWKEANLAIGEGTRDMLLNARDTKKFVAAYDMMDEALGELAERMDPPESVRRQLYDKIVVRIEVLCRGLENMGVDVSSLAAKHKEFVKGKKPAGKDPKKPGPLKRKR